MNAITQAEAASSSKLNNGHVRDIDMAWQQEPMIVSNDVGMDMDLSGAAALPLDPSLSNAMSFLDFLGPDFITAQPLQISSLPREIPIERGLLNFNIDFDSHASRQAAYSDTPGTSPPDLIHHSASTPSQSSQGVTPNGHHQDPSPTAASELSASSPSSIQAGPCACLSSLYLALSSIHSLPRNITAAVQVARSACRAAHDAIQCPVCAPPIHESVKYPAVSFTTMMNLGSLLPCIVDAYRQILEMIDAETSRAIACRIEPLSFSLAAHGGIWGTLHANQGATTESHQERQSTPGLCANALSRFDKQDMEPAQWRLTLRALLKVDVYGLERCDGGEGFTQIGLRDLVAQLEERSRQRHEQVDQMVEAGLTPPTGLAGIPQRHTNQGAPPCRQVIAIARQAVESLVIA